MPIHCLDKYRQKILNEQLQLIRCISLDTQKDIKAMPLDLKLGQWEYYLISRRKIVMSITETLAMLLKGDPLKSTQAVTQILNNNDIIKRRCVKINGSAQCKWKIPNKRSNDPCTEKKDKLNCFKELFIAQLINTRQLSKSKPTPQSVQDMYYGLLHAIDGAISIIQNLLKEYPGDARRTNNSGGRSQ